MSLSDRRVVCRLSLLSCLALIGAAGCHGHDDWEPLADQKIYVSDRFYDVAMLGPEHALIIGYNAKVLETTNAGLTWSQLPVDTKTALYSIDFADERTGWIVGQEAEILKTTDAGKTWTEQGGAIFMTDECRETNGGDDPTVCPRAPLFAVSTIDANNVVAVGDRSVITVTRDGGSTWQTSTLRPVLTEEIDPNQALAFEDPVLYDVQFLDAQNGFVVGEFGKIMKTVDGGQTWHGKQASLVGDEYFDELDLPTFFDVEFLNRSTGYVVGLEGRIARTDDGGETWRWMANNVDEYDAPFYSAAALPNGDVWVVGASGQVMAAKASGDFSKGSFGSQVNNWIRQVKFYDNERGFVVGGFGFIMYTQDGGKTWFRRIG